MGFNTTVQGTRRLAARCGWAWLGAAMAMAMSLGCGGDGGAAQADVGEGADAGALDAGNTDTGDIDTGVSDTGAPGDAAADAEDDSAPPPGATPIMTLTGETNSPESFFDWPWPSDLRLTERGAPDWRGFPNPTANSMIAEIVATAGERRGWPVTSLAWFRFSAPLAPRALTDVVAPDPATAPALVVDIDPDSPERGRALPAVLQTMEPDPYTPEWVLAVAPRPGFVLAPERTYAVVVTRRLLGADGAPVAVAPAMEALRPGGDGGGGRGDRARALYAPLWPTLEGLGLAAEEVVAATVFTTGDVVADMAALREAVAAAHPATLAQAPALDPDDGADHARFCELHGSLQLAQFQRGEPPFDTEGLFEFASPDDALPIKQRDAEVPFAITFPKAPMPAGGYPLVMYFHGSGGLSTQVIDRGPVLEPGGERQPGLGPSHVLAPHGFATAGYAMPVNSERLPGASSLDYINLFNLASYRDNMRQGTLEQRLVLDALLDLRVPPEALEGCDGPELPDGEEAFRFAAAPIMAMGQSQGAIYANMTSALDPRVKALTPTGAGGFWSYQILVTESIDGAKELITLFLGTDVDVTWTHPAMHALQTAWEPVDPLAYVTRLAHDPLPGHPTRSIYQPVGLNDEFYPNDLLDALALAYRTQQAGEPIWASMQEALALADLDGFAPYPVQGNRLSLSGAPYTAVVAQYEGDGIVNSHAIFAQLDEVKHQYGCFFATLLMTGAATVPAPAPLGSGCVP